MTTVYRQKTTDPTPFFSLVGLAVILYICGGFFVYWLITGSTTIGVGGRRGGIADGRHESAIAL